MSREAELLMGIARQVRNGRVPEVGNLSRVFSGRGDDDTKCDVCGIAIDSSEVVYEFIFDRQGQEQSLTAHLRCHELWLQTVRQAH
jgi:hypothetical protein